MMNNIMKYRMNIVVELEKREELENLIAFGCWLCQALPTPTRAIYHIKLYKWHYMTWLICTDCGISPIVKYIYELEYKKWLIYQCFTVLCLI
jgi:hypothetical protein